MGNIWEWLLGQAADAFGLSGDNGMEQVIDNLFRLPIPPLDSPFFNQIYGTTWALGVIVGMLAGWFSAFIYLGRSMRDIGNVVPMAARWTFFIQVLIVGFVAMPGTALALYVADVVADGVLLLPGADNDPTWLHRLAGFSSFGDPIAGGLMGMIEWLFAWMLTGETAALTFSVFPVLALTPLFYGLSIAGNAGLALWRLWVALWALTITVKPVIAWTLGIGNAFAGWIQSDLALVDVSSWVAFSTMLFAAALPLVMIFLYFKKVAPEVRPAYVSGAAAVGAPGGPSVFYKAATAGAIGLGAIATRQASQSTDKAPRMSGQRRLQASSALSNKAMILARAHPGTAAAAAGASVVLGTAGKRAQARAQAAPTAPTGRPMRQPYVPPRGSNPFAPPPNVPDRMPPRPPAPKPPPREEG